MKGLTRNVATWAAYGLVRALYATWRIRFATPERMRAAESGSGGSSYVFGIWHQNVLAGIMAQTGKRHVCIVSPSSDGDLVAFALERLGHAAARGSSSRGGRRGRDDMVEEMRGGLPAAITVDGPRGPAKVVKPGVIDVARRTGAYVVPYVPLPDRYWEFRSSWDNFRLPKPFCRIVVRYGEPIEVPPDVRDEAFDELRERLHDALDMEEKLAEEDLRRWDDLPHGKSPP